MTEIISGINQFIGSSSFWTLIGVILGSFLTFFFSSLQAKSSEKKEIVKVANIIYLDLKGSIDAMEIQLVARNRSGVIDNPFIFLKGEFPKLIVELKSKLSDKDMTNLFNYYMNISLLEDQRIKYTEKCNDKLTYEEKSELINKYFSFFNAANEASQNILHPEQILEKIRVIASP